MDFVFACLHQIIMRTVVFMVIIFMCFTSQMELLLNAKYMQIKSYYVNVIFDANSDGQFSIRGSFIKEQCVAVRESKRKNE